MKDENLSQGRPQVSVVVPLYNEQDSIRPLHAAIVTALAPLGISFELLFVDDGSQDSTFERARDLAREDPCLRVIRFRRNCGQTAAMAAGIEYASGEVVVTMDGDLQNDPRDIEHLLDAIRSGSDIVVGWRFDRKDSLSRRVPSRIANWLIARITGIPIKDNGCSLKAFRAELIKQIPLYSDMHRFIPAVASIAGPRVTEIKVRHHPRRYGQSKYGMSRIYKVLLDLMVVKTVAAFSSRPMLWFGLGAILTMIGGVLAITAAIAISLTRGSPESLPLASTGLIFLLSSVILVGSGALGELVSRLGDVRHHELARLTESVWVGPERDASR